MNEAAVNDWESEGGTVPASADRSEGYPPTMPPLPEGYSVQAAWGFRDPSGSFSYEFCRVYAPPVDAGPAGAICQLDEGLSFWVMLWHAVGDGGDEHPAARWMTFDQARQRARSRLTFRRFAAPVGRRDQAPRFLEPAGDR